MQLMPGMTQQQRQRAADSYAQFNQRITGRPMGGSPAAAPQPAKPTTVGGFGTYNPSQPAAGGQSPWMTYAPKPQSPGAAQPKQPSIGSQYAPHSKPWPSLVPQVGFPDVSAKQPKPPKGYGGGYGSGGMRTMEFRDRDRDGVDDRDQSGPGMTTAPQPIAPPMQVGPAVMPPDYVYPKEPPMQGPGGRRWQGDMPARVQEPPMQGHAPAVMPPDYVYPNYGFGGQPTPPRTAPMQGASPGRVYAFGGQPQSNFQTSVVTPDGSQFSPQQFYPQRDAFIQRLNDERGRQAAQSGVYGPGQAPQFYQPSRDFGAMWGQAGDMVRGGWTNPLAGLFG